MIEFTKAFKVGDSVFPSLELAQRHELEALFSEWPIVDNPEFGPKGIALRILECKDKIVDILTTTTASKPKARSINGGKKHRRRVVQQELVPPVG